MSAITKIVKVLLVLDKKIQTTIGTGAVTLAGKAFAKGDAVYLQAVKAAIEQAEHLEGLRKVRLQKLHTHQRTELDQVLARHKAALIHLHEGIDAALELNDSRQAQELAASKQRKKDAANWHNTAARAAVSVTKADKAIKQLEM